MKIRVGHTESGCWAVTRDTYVLAIYPSHMWHQAYREALREAIYQNLSVVGMEIAS